MPKKSIRLTDINVATQKRIICIHLRETKNTICFRSFTKITLHDKKLKIENGFGILL